MERPKLTIGMACFDDYDGVIFTIQSLALYQDVSQCELIVVDNNPGSPHGQAVSHFVRNKLHNSKWHSVKYIAMPESTGTTQPRERIFQEATGEAVLCMDCHVLLWPGAIERLIAYYDENPESKDILSGPLVYDNLDPRHMSTHFDPVWRAEMYGIWAMDERGLDLDAEPFEIPGQGLGVFTCRKDAWLGFNPHFRGFGGEELYIHEKFRKAGHKALCLPFLRWWHRFGRVGGPKYPLTLWFKVRNYVLGFQELGLDLQPIYDHFVASRKMAKSDWDRLVKDPIGNVYQNKSEEIRIKKQNRHLVSTKNAPQTQLQTSITERMQSLDGMFEVFRSTPRDLDQHAEFIRELAKRSRRVTGFVKRKEWNVFLAAGRPESLHIYQSEYDQVLDQLHQIIRMEGDQEKVPRVFKYSTTVGDLSLDVTEIEETDLLVLDTVHSADRVWQELQTHGPRVKERILIRGTGAFGVKAEGGQGAGLFDGIRQWLQENPEWFVASHTNNQYGMTLLSRLPEDKPEKEIIPWPPGKGPGTELKKILSSLGIEASASCDCNAKAQQMDMWGVETCEANRETIIQWLRDGQDRWGWTSKFSAAGKALLSGLAFKLNPMDPIPGLVDESIRRAKKAEKKAGKNA